MISKKETRRMTTTNEWSDDIPTSSDINFTSQIKIPPPPPRPSLTLRAKDQFDQHFTMSRKDCEEEADKFLKNCANPFEEHAQEAAFAFYKNFKSACHGISRRDELDRLYNATYESFGGDVVTRPPFNRVLFAMARNMHVVKVIGGGTLEWTAFDRRPRCDDRPRFDRHDDRRPQFDGRRDHRDDRRPRYDDRRQDDRHDDRRPQFDGRRDHRDDCRPRFDGRHQDDRHDDRRPRFDEQRHHYHERF